MSTPHDGFRIGKGATPPPPAAHGSPSTTDNTRRATLPFGAYFWGCAKYLAPDERIILATRPSPWFILLHANVPLLIAAMFAMVGMAWAWYGPAMPEVGGLIVRLAIVILLLHLAIGILRWLSRLYVLTERRVIVVAGVLAQQAGDVPLARVQHVVVDRTLLERILRLGTLGIATAGGGGGDGTVIRWLIIAKPARIMATIRAMTDATRQDLDDAHHPAQGTRTTRHARGSIVVIGLAGGIGSGKSHVARHFADLGCIVIDSDREAKDALERPEVRSALVSWWGEEILEPQTTDDPSDARQMYPRKIDRSKIARIIFSDPTERARLEGLVHPIIRSKRSDVIERASAQGAPAAVIDAPLLFEAGVDAECDVVVWVEASRKTRLERVIHSRGWDEAELDRREAAQWPLERKRALCRYTITNEGAQSHPTLNPSQHGSGLTDDVRRILNQILASNTRSAGT